MLQWDDLRVFLALGRSKTQRAAAKSLGVDQATVGRRVREFESQLGAKLFDKRSDGFILTAAGRALWEKTQEVESLISEMERGVSALDQKPKGWIRVALPGGLANHWLIPRLRPFLRAYPEIRIEFLTGPEVVNLWKREADVAIRLVEPIQKELLVRRLGEIRLSAYATKEFLSENERHAKLQKKDKGEALTDVPFVGLFDSAMSSTERSLLARIGIQTAPVFRTHAWSSVFYAVRAGIGFGILPSFYAEREKSLVELTRFPSAKTPLFLVMHPDVKGSGRVKVFTQFLGEIS